MEVSDQEMFSSPFLSMLKQGIPYVIAEIGINFQGSLPLALDLIRIAKNSGAHCVKFQKRNISRILCEEGLSQPYNGPNSFAPHDNLTYGAHKKALELSIDQYKELYCYAHSNKIDFSASAWDQESADELESIGPLPFIKVASADLTNLCLLRHVARKGIPMMISTGMAALKDVHRAVQTIRSISLDLILVICHCTSSYPAPIEQINLRVIPDFQRLFASDNSCTYIGYSGHEEGTLTTIAAVALGAVTIERHFTLCKQMKGGDHAASLEPCEFAKLCRDIHDIASALGVPQKNIQPSEHACFLKLTKSIVSARYIAKGSFFTVCDLTVKGPGADARHISPLYMEELVNGGWATEDIAADIRISKRQVGHASLQDFISPIDRISGV